MGVLLKTLKTILYSPPYTNACTHCTYTARRTWSLWPWESAEGKLIHVLNQTGNWQMKNDFFFCAGTVLCALFRSVLRNVRVAGTRVSTHCRTVRRQNWTGKWPKTSIIANFSVRKSCVFIFGSLCCSLSPKTRVSDFQFFPDSEEDKSEYVDVQWTLILWTKKKKNGSYRHFAFSAKDTPMFTDHVFNWLANHTDAIFIKARQNDILWFYSLY